MNNVDELKKKCINWISEFILFVVNLVGKWIGYLFMDFRNWLLFCKIRYWSLFRKCYCGKSNCCLLSDGENVGGYKEWM